MNFRCVTTQNEAAVATLGTKKRQQSQQQRDFLNNLSLTVVTRVTSESRPPFIVTETGK